MATKIYRAIPFDHVIDEYAAVAPWMPWVVDYSAFGNMGISLWTCTTSFAFTGRWRIRRQFRLRNPNRSASNVTRGRNTVALYTKRQEPREDEFVIDTNTSASIPPETSEILGESRLNGDPVGSEIRTPTGEASAGRIVGRPKV
jgi:hypothetical protein